VWVSLADSFFVDFLLRQKISNDDELLLPRERAVPAPES